MNDVNSVEMRPRHPAILLVPRLRVQNANAISSPMTWGFPSITAFAGLMVAMERHLGRNSGIRFLGVGVICHGHEAQVTVAGFVRKFHLTRNPVSADGSTGAIVEEGRIHLDISLVFEVKLSDEHKGQAERQALAQKVLDRLSRMRLAGGSIMPALPLDKRRNSNPWMELLPPEDAIDKCHEQFRALARRCLPGFALVSRDDLLQTRHREMQAIESTSTVMDAWLDLSRMTFRLAPTPSSANAPAPAKTEWVRDPREGWIVPIPVGYTALSKMHAPGTVSNARDSTIPFYFVETIWSVGQWISPHRLTDLQDLIWRYEPPINGTYRCTNRFKPARSPELETADESFDD